MLFLMGTSTGAAFAISAPGADDVKITQQSETATGTVVDAMGPVIGASVVVKGTTNGTITDFDGNFSIPGVKKGDILQVSFVGYITQDVVWNGTALNITLAEDTQTLDEVVVTALGMKRSTKALGYAVTEMKGEDLSTAVVNPVNALQGKVAGVEISQSDGGMFGSTKIQIRGASTLGANNQPIYVVDGVILDNSVKKGSADWDGTGYGDYGNELKNLNPDDFETVSVLKGAAATALYGSRGLNGAVVITTKSGKKGQGLGINFSQTFGVDHVYAQPDLQYEYGQGQYAGNVSYGQTDANGNYYIFDNLHQFKLNGNGQPTLIGQNGRHWGPKFDGSSIEYFDGKTTSYSPVENNYKDAYNLGFNTNTNVSVQGGNDKTTFYTSLSYKYMNGTLPNNSFERLSMLAKATHMITDKVELEAGISFANSNPKNAQPSIGEYFVDTNNGPLGNMYDTNKWRHLYKGEHGGLADSSYGDEYGRIPGRGLWWSIYENDYSQKETTVRPNIILRWDLLDWLKFTAEGNYNYYYRRYENKQPNSGYAKSTGGYYGMGQYQKEQTNLNASFSWNKTFGDWTTTGFVRGEYYNNIEQAMSGNTNGGLVVPDQYFLNNSKNAASYSGQISGEKRMLSVAFQAGVSWRDQVFVDVTGRNDWSSSLVYGDTHGNYSYFYPSVSASWLIHETLRGKLPEWISFAKIRGSWAQVGNDTDSYSINSAYSMMSGSAANGNFYTLTLPTTAYSQNLKPERKNAWEFGLDWRFLQNRIGIDFTYYKENTKDQIMSISVPGVSGINNQLINAGNIQNSGVDLAINTTPIETKDWTWDLNFTWTKNEGKIIELHENVTSYIKLIDDAYTNYGNFRIAPVAKVGEAFGALMSDSAPMRDWKYDEDGNIVGGTGLPVFTTYGWSKDGMRAAMYARSGKEEIVGSMQPDFLGSVNTSLRYKNWTLRASMDMRFGGYVASYGSRYGTTYGMTKTSLKWRDEEHGGMTFKSIWDGQTYHDGMIPEGIFQEGTVLATPSGNYTVATGGETYQQLYEKGLVDPQHGSTWTYWQNSWGNGVLNDDWFTELNYIALREVSLSYRMPQSICDKIKARNINLTLAGRNLGYLLNSMPNGENPESVRGTVATEFRVRSFNCLTANYTFTINVGF